ncbi:MAG: hypothetical protein ABIU30_12590 [Ferruginibacter sp.]
MLQTASLKGKKINWGILAERRQIVLLIFIFSFSLIARYNEYYNFREFHSDKSRQLHGAYELLNGKGVSFESYDLTTLQPQVQPIIDWPPAYSYAIAAISYVTGLNVYKASVVLDVICLTALWVIFFWLTSLLNFTLLQRTLLFLLFSVAKTLFIKLYSGDLLATTLFMFSTTVSLFIIQKKAVNRAPKFAVALLFASVFLMIFLKYSFWPVCFAIGLSIVSYSHFSAKKLYRIGFYLLLLCLVSIGVLILYNQFRSGLSSGMENRHPNKKSHLYFENLLLFDPFIVNGFFYLDVFYTRFNYHLTYFISQISSALILIWAAVHIVKRIRDKQADYFSHLVLITSFSLLGFLTALSVYYPKDAYGSFEWTYVTEYRYFAPAVFLLIFYLVKNLSFSWSGRLAQFAISAFVVISICCTFILGVYYWMINNKAGSFENLYGKIFRVNEFVEKQKGGQTYFISLSNHPPTDTEATSLVAINGTKVAMSYYGYFPDSTFNILFSKTKLLPQGKKFILFLDHNDKILDSINLTNRHKIEQNSEGEKFLVINN